MSLNLPRRLFAVPVVGAVAAFVLIVVSLAITRSAVRAAGVSRQLSAIDHQACNAQPRTWGFRSGGMSLFAYDRAGHAENPQAPPLEAGMLRRVLEDGETAESMSSDVAVFVVPYAPAGPCAIMRVSSPNIETVIGPRLTAILVTALGGGMLLAAAGTLWFIVLPMRRRIAELAEAAQHVGGNTFTTPPVQGDALGHIAEVLAWSHTRIVETQGALQLRNASLENHLAGIAHDLRTPLSSMHLALEALAAEPYAPVQKEARRALADAVYLSSMVENLHQAARLRHEVDVAAGRVELGDLVRRLEQRFAIVGRHAGIEVAAVVPDATVWARCRPAFAERAIANLVQNAVEHNPGPGHVALTLEVTGQDWRLIVDDDGPGLPDGVPAGLDDTLFDVEGARPRGPGLGMVITAEIARRAEWSLSYEPLSPTGLRVCVQGRRVGAPD
ncbi:MAG: HAMP domain-containing sensor histidine kinase [Myxococcota bacterium]